MKIVDVSKITYDINNQNFNFWTKNEYIFRKKKEILKYKGYNYKNPAV